MECRRCGSAIRYLYDGAANLDLALTVVFTGSYGEYADVPLDGSWGEPPQFVLCHDCGHALERWLGVDLSGLRLHDCADKRGSGTDHKLRSV